MAKRDADPEAAMQVRRPTWLRLPLPKLSIPPLEPEAWSRQMTPKKGYAGHNLYHGGTDGVTNEARHRAVTGCLVAFSRFLRAKLPDAQWWLDSGTLIGALRTGRFIPWDEVRCPPSADGMDRMATATAVRPMSLGAQARARAWVWGRTAMWP